MNNECAGGGVSVDGEHGGRAAAAGPAAELVPVPAQRLQLRYLSDPVRAVHDGGRGAEDHHGGAGAGRARAKERHLAVVRAR